VSLVFSVKRCVQLLAQRPQFQGQIQQALDRGLADGEFPALIENCDAPFFLRVDRLRNNTAMGYRSAIALQLSGRYKKATAAIASTLADILARQQSQWEIQVSEGSWIEGRLRDRVLAHWLQQWLDEIPINAGKNESFTPLTPALLPIQYAHARCCSILHLAHRDRLIQLVNPDTPPPWSWQSPQTLSWLDGRQLRLRDRAEMALLGQIWDLADAMAAEETSDWLKLGYRLSEAVLQFEQTCRIWGEVKREQPQLAQTRLGLIAIAQMVLWGLLRECLSATPRSEL
jgi:hypothetical protein